MPINYSEVRKYSKLHFLAKKEVEGFLTGMHKSPLHGYSVEFAEHKQYNTGESTRHIDWKLYARTDKLYVKKYEEETNLRCLILLDTSNSMHYKSESSTKIEFAIRSSAALIHLLQQQRDAIGICDFGSRINRVTPIKSSSLHVSNLFRFLEDSEKPTDVGSKSAIGESIYKSAPLLKKRSLVIIFSDFFENHEDQESVFKALQLLKHNQHEVIIFNLLDEDKEEAFNFKNRAYEFIDSETKESIKVFPNEIKENYTQLITAHKHNIKLKCHQYQIDFVDVDINKNLDQVLLPYLRRRDKFK